MSNEASDEPKSETPVGDEVRRLIWGGRTDEDLLAQYKAMGPGSYGRDTLADELTRRGVEVPANNNTWLSDHIRRIFTRST